MLCYIQNSLLEFYHLMLCEQMWLMHRIDGNGVIKVADFGLAED